MLIKRKWWLAIGAAVVVLALPILVYWLSAERSVFNSREQLLSRIPAQAQAVLFVDVRALRSSPILAEISGLAKDVSIDPEYLQFARETGFDYQRDLDMFVSARWDDNAGAVTLVFACGDFDAKKMAAYASRNGTKSQLAGHEVFVIASPHRNRNTIVTFLDKTCVAITNDADPAVLFSKASGSDAEDWRSRFIKLSGSPIFAVLRQDSISQSVLTVAKTQLRSPQLAQLVEQLQWISIGGKPEGEALRLVAEGEASDPKVTTQLGEMINGLVLLGQAGLNDPRAAKDLAPNVRQAYLQMLRTVDVSKVDRGENSAIRVMVQVSPEFFQVAATGAFPGVGPSPSPQQQNKGKSSK